MCIRDRVSPFSYRVHSFNLVFSPIHFHSFNNFVEGTNILPCKTFLLKRRWTTRMDSSQCFSPEHVNNFLREQGRALSVIIDLSHSEKAYCFRKLKRKYFPEILQDVEFFKIQLDYDGPPKRKSINQIIDVLRKHAFDEKGCVLIHCNKGINRTGFAICSFLCHHFRIPVQEAIKRFETARGIAMNHDSFIKELEDRYPQIAEKKRTMEQTHNTKQNINKNRIKKQKKIKKEDSVVRLNVLAQCPRSRETVFHSSIYPLSIL
eukprot:TRINITY_DN10392_c0_g1_i4.p1 TRINITY_DN10392_c0_g1~~TRINITY_DN10392_c0_g1_i4.p1  ORF type:complete len:289 (+),score=50.23 TRINITY_DN10392_c0_g1_i4:83-868(+)